MENFIYSSLWYHENSSRGQYVSTLNQFVDKHTVCMEEVWTLSISHYRLPDNLSARAAIMIMYNYKYSLVLWEIWDDLKWNNDT